MQELKIEVDDPLADDVRPLVERHLEHTSVSTPPQDCHALDLEGLRDPSVTFYSARLDGRVVGIGALKRLDGAQVELKSMHTAAEVRGRGVARAVLGHLLGVARERGYARISLETGTNADFAAARALYASVGFTPCPPFSDYLHSANSTHLSLALRPDAAPPVLGVAAYLATAPVSPVIGDRMLADTPHTVLDLSTGRPAVLRDDELLDQLREAGAEVGIGRYLERRAVYTTPAYVGATPGTEPRTVHMGVDLFVPEGTPVRAPLPGTVHLFGDNDAPQDYGPVVVLRHATADGTPFFTLYGHLARTSLPVLREGAPVAAGEAFATVGTRAENGGWTPHLHLQVLTDLLGMGLDVPGVVRRSEVERWRLVFPDPNLLLRLPEGLAATP